MNVTDDEIGRARKAIEAARDVALLLACAGREGAARDLSDALDRARRALPLNTAGRARSERLRESREGRMPTVDRRRP